MVSGSRSYVSGNRKPSSLPFAYDGSPRAAVSFAAACRSASLSLLFSEISFSVAATVRPSGTVTRLSSRADGSRISCSAAAPLICLCSLYVPGWMPSARGSSLAALANAFSLLTTPWATIVAAMSVAVSPGLTTTSASPEPEPG